MVPVHDTVGIVDRSNAPAWVAAVSAALMLVMVFFGGFATRDDLASVEESIDEVRGDIDELRAEIRELRGYFIAHLERTAPPEDPGQ